MADVLLNSELVSSSDASKLWQDFTASYWFGLKLGKKPVQGILTFVLFLIHKIYHWKILEI